ncbi:uncharacterized protein LOC117611402 isoform X3 [Osmia lignaria lignaria]|uniref:uncharacterized protein LOC117611402 isoform X3 n=1 Tax=Osmia lignaria lignaria TaxID=1437193 RepID=UPI00402B66D7
MQKWRNRCINSAVCSGIETSSEVANSVPVFREEGFIEESSFLVDVSLCGNENCKQIELGKRYYPQPADCGHLRILDRFCVQSGEVRNARQAIDVHGFLSHLQPRSRVRRIKMLGAGPSKRGQQGGRQHGFRLDNRW